MSGPSSNDLSPARTGTPTIFPSGKYPTTESSDVPHRNGELKLVSGNSNRGLAQEVAQELGRKLCESRVGKFANGETDIKILENVRGSDLFVFQPTCCSQEAGLNVNGALMELLLMLQTAKLASVKRVVAVVPHYGYARQDRKHTARVPISAAAVARMISEMGADVIVTVDLHCSQIQGFFHNRPVEDLNASVEFSHYFLTNKKDRYDSSEVTIVAPDAGAVNRARKLCDTLGANRIVTILKRRVVANQIESMQLVGEVDGTICIICDDMIDTAGTLVKAADMLASRGAREVHAWATHGILTDPACDRINKCDALREVVVTNSMPQDSNLAKCPKLRVISIAKLLAEAIHRVHREESMENVRQMLPQPGSPATENGSRQFPSPGASSGRLTATPHSHETTAITDDDEEDEWKAFPK